MQKGNIKKIITFAIIILSLFINQAYSQISFGIKAGLRWENTTEKRDWKNESQEPLKIHTIIFYLALSYLKAFLLCSR